MYTIDVSPEDWEDTDLRSWMLDTVENKMGCLIEYSDTESRPISFPPLLNLQPDVDRIEKEKGREVGEYVAYNWNNYPSSWVGRVNTPITAGSFSIR